jgi:hypothetical protein
MVHVTFATVGTYVADADGYDIASDGTNIAVALAGVGGNVVLVESADNGATWSQTVIYDADETGFTDEPWPDGSVSCVYDNDGDVHIAWGTYHAIGDGINIEYNTQYGIQHWSAASGVQQIATARDSLMVFGLRADTTVAFWRDGSIATQPDLSVDADNNIYCVYSSYINEVQILGTDTSNYEHVMGVASDNNGMTWSNQVDLTPGTGFDASFPSIADDVDGSNNINLTYLCDPYAGNWLQQSAAIPPGLHPHIEVAIMYANIARYDFFPLCDDITSFIARCVNPGTVQARVVLRGTIADPQVIHSGQTVLFDIDETIVPGTIGDNGVSSRASIEFPGAGVGDHTVSLVDPADCYSPIVVTCSASKATADAEWAADDALWAAEIARQTPSTEGNPVATTLLGNYPNPFNPTTNISYSISEGANVTLKIYNMLGEEVVTLVNGFQEAGFKTATWDGRNLNGTSVASGMYIYRLKAGNVVKSEKMMFMK